LTTYNVDEQTACKWLMLLEKMPGSGMSALRYPMIVTRRLPEQTSQLNGACLKWPNAQGKRHRSTEGAEGTNKGQDNGEALALVGVRLTAQLGWRA
jgi:hypothetical protein